MAMAGDDGCAARCVSLTSPPAGERPGTGAGRGDRATNPRTREPGHTHQAPSVTIIDEPARIGYYAGDALRFESQERFESPPGARVSWIWMEPKGPHSVENIDEYRCHAIRVELK